MRSWGGGGAARVRGDEIKVGTVDIDRVSVKAGGQSWGNRA